MKKLWLYTKLLWLYLTEKRYKIVLVEPNKIYRIRKYYKRLPNLTKKYVMSVFHSRVSCKYEETKQERAKETALHIEDRHIRNMQKILDQINEKEVPVE